MKELHFWTDGSSFTGLLTDLFRSGEFKKFEAILKDGGLDEDRMLKAFSFKFEFTGSTQNGGEMGIHFLEKSPDDFNDILYFSVLTAIKNVDHELGFIDIENKELKKDPNLKVLFKYCSLEEIKKHCWVNIVEEGDFKVTTMYDAITRSDYSISGLLLRTGEFVECDYQCHAELYPLLRSLNLVQGHDRLDSDAMSVSSNMLSGSLAFHLQSGSYDSSNKGFELTTRQMEELWKLKDHKLAHYSSAGRLNSVNAQMLVFYTHKRGFGGKFGNLEFLKKFYPDVPITNYSLSSDNNWSTTIVRTSPKKSLPGLLNSIKVTNKEEVKIAVDKIITDFHVHKELVRYNEIFWFFQEYMEGQNGVVNCIAKPRDQYPSTMSSEYTATLKYDIDIACSTVQGNIVEGHISNIEVGFSNAAYLRRLSRRLAEDFDSDIQLEYVILPNEDLKIVQLRILENAPNKNYEVKDSMLEDALVIGKTFCSPEYSTKIEVAFEDILIVEQDCESEKLLGKKALIVENDTNFSHILALSKALKIPSMYATGKVILEGKTTFTFNTEYTTGFIK